LPEYFGRLQIYVCVVPDARDRLTTSLPQLAKAIVAASAHEGGRSPPESAMLARPVPATGTPQNEKTAAPPPGGVRRTGNRGAGACVTDGVDRPSEHEVKGKRECS
jgi:hypothetical protein